MTTPNRGAPEVVGLISSVRAEGDKILRKIALKKIRGKQCIFPTFIGQFQGKRVIYKISGIGKTNAAAAAALLIKDFCPGAIINFGIGGAYPLSQLKAGDVVIAEKEIYGDEGVIDIEGFHGTDRIGIPLLRKGSRKFFNEFGCDPGILRRLRHFLMSDRPGSITRQGIFVTVSSCSGMPERALALEERFGAICENMEGAAVAHVCRMFGIPMAELRGISNIAGDRDKLNWDISLAASRCQETVLRVLEYL